MIQEPLIYTCQVPEYFGLVKCTIVLPPPTSEEFIHLLHVLRPEVQRLVNQARMGKIFNEVHSPAELSSSSQDLALVPFLQPVPLSQLPL